MDKDIRFIFDPRSWALLFQIQFIADTFCLSVLCLHLEIDIPARRRTPRAPDAATLCPECGNDLKEGHKYLCHLR